MALNYLSYTLLTHDHLMELKRLLASYAEHPQISAWIAEVDRQNEKLENMRFQVAVVGEFKRGKTSFINALLRKSVLPADVVPATATVNRVTYGNVPSAYIFWNNGRPMEKVEIDQLADYITKITDQAAMQARNIKEAVVHYPCRFCENNVDLIDTPGMNDDDAMNSVTIRQLSDIDLAIVTLDPGMPVSQTEARFIAQLVESSQICQLVFVVSKMDTVFAAHRERLLKLLEGRLQSLVRTALLENHGESDPVMEKYEELFTKPVIFPVSNTEALRAYELGDMQALEDSGFRRLNEELLPLIIRTQHRAAVVTPLNTVIRVSGDFSRLLREWERRTVEEDDLQALKKSFAETVYGTRPDSKRIRAVCFGWLDRLGNQRGDAVSDEILGVARSRKDMVLNKVRELFRTLTAELAQEEQNSYHQVWNQYFGHKYAGLVQRLSDIVAPYPELSQRIDPELKELLNCASLLEVPADPEPFYWEISPVPPMDTPPGQLPYRIDSAVRASFTGYYRRRQSRLADFLERAAAELEEKQAALVQAFFELAKSAVPETEYIRMERETLERLSGQLQQLARNCDDARENYLKESENNI